MSLPASHIKPEEIDSAEKRGKYTVCIIGCGENGVFHAYLFLEAGFKVTCVDANQTIVNQLSKGKASFLKREIELKLRSHTKTGHLRATNDIRTAVSQGDIVAITIPVRVDKKRKLDYSELESTCKHVGSSLRRGSLVIVMSVNGIGITEGVIKDVLESTSGFKVGADFGLAYSPVRVENEDIVRCKRIVAASDKDTLNTASAILESIAKNGLRITRSIKTAEATTLFELSRLDVDLALANELAVFCEKACIDYLEVRKLMKPDTYCEPPMPTLADISIQESYLLLEDAENLDAKLRIPATARDVNEKVIKHIVNLTRDALRDCGKTLRRARIALLGISQTPNMKSRAKKTVRGFAKMLEAKGARISLYDPYFSSDELAEMQLHGSKNLTESIESVDCIMILTGHEQFKRLNLRKLKVVVKMPAAIVDLQGIVEPANVEKEGFIYRGLGRGVWTK